MSQVQDQEQQYLIEKLQRLRTNLARLELQSAEFGTLNVPLYLQNDIENHKEEIEKVEERLRAIQKTVELPALEIPQNLPAAVGGFVGREAEMGELIEQIEGRWPLICVEGIGGIGKTSLSIEAAHRMMERQYFDGAVWMSAKDWKLTLNDLLNTIARVLEYEKLAQLPAEEKRSMVRKLLRTGRYLILVDNFETIEDGRILDFVTDIPEPSKALITSRQIKIPSAWLIHLKGLPRAEAMTLIRTEAERLDLDPIVQAPDEVLARLYEGTGGVPLAIKWSLGQIRQKGQTLERVLSNLYQARGDVFESIFSRSFDMLTINARQVLRSLLVFSAPASQEAIAAVSGIKEFELDEALGQLVEMLLVNMTGILTDAHYDIHPLTRAYARKELLEKDGLEGQKAYLSSAKYFLTYVKSHAKAVDRSQSYRALEQEHANIFASLYWCYETGRQVEAEQAALWGMLVAFADGLADYLWGRGYWAERVDICAKAYEACIFLDDWEGAGRQTYAIGWVYWEQGNIDLAQQWAEKCQQAMKQANRPEGLSLAKHLLGLVAMRRAEYSNANTYFMEALKMTPPERAGVGGPGSIMSELGHLHRVQGKLDEAKIWYEKCMAENERTGFTEGLGISKGYLAQTLFLMGQLAQAETLYREALKIAIKVGRATTIARIHRGLAEILFEQGRFDEAREHAQEALPIYERLDKQADRVAMQELLAKMVAR
ncbi:MAG: tetratricopeptide repeat protein [Chloroflexota bacterium]